jgi:hypothetical protein
MPFLVLYHNAWNRAITYGELIPAMQIPTDELCGPVHAEGVFGTQYAVRIGDMDLPVLFHDRQSALNAALHLKKDMDVDAYTFDIRELGQI